MGKATSGTGSIRKKTVTRNGKAYTYWEARVTVGKDPGTGRQIQRSFTGKTKAEVAQKMTATAAEVNAGTYTAPCRLTVGAWLDCWVKDYLGDVKPLTKTRYIGDIENKIKPAMGAVKLESLAPHSVQAWINQLPGSPATVRLTAGVLRNALETAVSVGYLTQNPVVRCVLPRAERVEIRPLDEHQLTALLTAAQGGKWEYLLTVAALTGLRQSELLGLTWDCVDFEHSTINVNKQLAPARNRADLFQSPKSGKGRIIAPAKTAMAALKRQHARQAEQQLAAGAAWNNPAGLVFTSDSGEPLTQRNVQSVFQTIIKRAGLEGVRFHDLRHTYAVNALRAGDDVKTVQSNLGHATAAFTLDRYAHFTEGMARDSAERMENFISQALGF